MPMARLGARTEKIMDRLDFALRTRLLRGIRPKQGLAGEISEPERVARGDLLVASYNVHKCVGTDGRFDPDRTIRVIREIGADVIALQEADKRFGERNGLLDLDRLERETGLARVPVPGRAKAHGWHGNVVLFRRGSVRNVRRINLPGLEPRGAILTEIELEGGGAVRIIAAHFGLLRRSRTRQVDMICDIMRDGHDVPTLLMGDLNEWRLNERSALSLLESALGRLPPSAPSFPSRFPLLALDRIIADRQALLSPVIVHDTPLARLASDHLPIKAFVTLAAANHDLAGDRRQAA